MPEQTDTFISSFPDAESISNADKVTGLQSNVNKNFTFSAILSWLVNAIRSAFVPANRMVNNKSLATDITLTASDVGARPDTWIPTAGGIGAIPASEKGEPLGVPDLDSSGKVPSSQLPTIPSQPSDIGAQDEITASGILKGDGAGGVGAATAGTDYQAPLTPGTDYQTPLVAGTDYATPGQLDAKANQAQLAVVESGSTASVDHAVNTYFCWNGLLYRATAKISTGQSFTPGTNCEAVTAGGELLDRCRTMTAEVPKGKSVDIVITGNNFTPYHGFILLSTGNQPSRMMGVWLCFGLGVRSNYHSIQPLHTSGATSLSLTSTVDGKYTFTNSDATYDCYVTVAVLQETGTGDRYLSLSAPY